MSNHAYMQRLKFIDMYMQISHSVLLLLLLRLLRLPLLLPVRLLLLLLQLLQHPPARAQPRHSGRFEALDHF